MHAVVLPQKVVGAFHTSIGRPGPDTSIQPPGRNLVRVAPLRLASITSPRCCSSVAAASMSFPVHPLSSRMSLSSGAVNARSSSQ